MFIVDLWKIFNFAHIYNPESELIYLNFSFAAQLKCSWVRIENRDTIKCIILPLNPLKVYKVSVDD